MVQIDLFIREDGKKRVFPTMTVFQGCYLEKKNVDGSL